MSTNRTTADIPPALVSTSDVQDVCRQLGLQDWTNLDHSHVSLDDAEIIRLELGHEALRIGADDFRSGLEVELEHGRRFTDANITNNHPLLTGKIVLAHLKEMLDYYPRLRLAELEGDMFNALVEGDEHEVAGRYSKVLDARAEVARWETSRLRSSHT